MGKVVEVDSTGQHGVLAVSMGQADAATANATCTAKTNGGLNWGLATGRHACAIGGSTSCLIVRCIPAAAAVIVPAEIFPAHAGQVVRLLRLQDMSAKHHFKKSFLRQKKQTPSVVRRCLYGGRIIGSFCGWRQFLPAGRR